MKAEEKTERTVYPTWLTLFDILTFSKRRQEADKINFQNSITNKLKF